MRTLLPALLLFAVLTGCEQEDAAAPNGAPEGAPEEVIARCGELASAIEAMLGPKFKKPVPVRLVDKTFIDGFARETVARTVPKETERRIERLAVRLKQIPADCSMLETQIRLLQLFAAGFYDPHRHCYYVIKGKAEPGTAGFDVTAAHELVHAYRAVGGDFWKRVEREQLIDEDYAIAISCLAEGDAEIIGQTIGDDRPVAEALADAVDVALHAPALVPTALAMPQMRDVPLVLRETLVTRYYIGQGFAAQVYRSGGFKALAKAFADLPRSTEQILHPEKYIGPDFDEPTRLQGGDPTKALGEGWKRLLTNTMGEFSLRVHLTEHLGRKHATRVAEGWDGARYYFCEKAAHPGSKERPSLFVGLVSVWDSEQDAAEFADAWARWASLRDDPKAPREVATKGADRRVATADGVVVVRLVGARVAVADGVPTGREEHVLAALLAARAK